MRISDWSSDVCSSDLLREGRLLLQPCLVVGLLVDHHGATHGVVPRAAEFKAEDFIGAGSRGRQPEIGDRARHHVHLGAELGHVEIVQHVYRAKQHLDRLRSEEHTSELQSLMRISYAVFCLTKKIKNRQQHKKK